MPHALPGLIKGLDMDKKRKGLIADMAVVDPTAGGNPVKLTKKAALTLLENAIAGDSLIRYCFAGYARTCLDEARERAGRKRKTIASQAPA